MLNDQLSEQLTLGLMINNLDAAFQGISSLDAGCFTEPRFKTLFGAIKSVVERENDISIYKINQELDILGKPLSFEDITNIEDKFYFEEKMDSLISILIECKNKRDSYQKLSAAQDELKNTNKPHIEIINDLDLIDSIQSTSANTTFISPKNHVEFRKALDTSKGTRTWINTGLPEVDEKLTYGLSRGEVSVIAARPSNGKSATKLNFIEGICKQGIGAASYALEQTLEVESDRMESLVSGIPSDEIASIYKWGKDDERWPKIHAAREKVASWNYHLIAGINKSLHQTKQEMKVLKREGVEVFFFDLFDRFSEIANATSNKPQIITKYLVSMLALTQELNIHTCLLVQLSRDAVKRKSLKPQLSDLKESGSYEEVARLIFFLHYPKAYDRTLVESNLTLGVAKQNNGDIFEKEFRFSPNINKIFNENNSQAQKGLVMKKKIKKLNPKESNS